MIRRTNTTKDLDTVISLRVPKGRATSPGEPMQGKDAKAEMIVRKRLGL